MQSISLTYYQRVILWMMVGNHQAPNLGQAAPFLRIIEKMRLSDKEQAETEFKTEAQGCSWKLPSPSYGDKTINLENEEGKALIATMDAAPVKIIDAEWMQKVRAELAVEEKETPKPRPKPLAMKG